MATDFYVGQKILFENQAGIVSKITAGRVLVKFSKGSIGFSLEEYLAICIGQEIYVIVSKEDDIGSVINNPKLLISEYIIEEYLLQYKFAEAEDYYALCINNFDDKDWFVKTRRKYKLQYEEKLKSEIISLLLEYKFSEADSLYESSLVELDKKWYVDSVTGFKTKYYQCLIEESLLAYRFDDAEKHYEREAKKYVTQEWYQGNREKYLNEYRLKQSEHFRAELKEALKEYNFSKAENLYCKHLEDIDDQWHFEETKFYKTELSKCHVEKYLSNFEFALADQYFDEQANNYVDFSWYKGEKDNYVLLCKNEIIEKLEKYLFLEAEQLYLMQGKDCIDKQWFDYISEQYKEQYRVGIKEEIEVALSKYDFVKADDLFNDCIVKIDYLWYRDKYDSSKKKLVMSEIKQFFQEHNFEAAYSCYLENKDFVDNEWFDLTYKSEYDNVIRQETEVLHQFLVKFDIAGAEKYYQEIKFFDKSKIEYFSLVKKYRDILDCLERYDFMRADKLCEQLNVFDYERFKVPYAEKWFQQEVKENNEPYKLDNEQIMAVINSNKNTIVEARAGSGKTLTLVAKIIYLMAKYNVKSNEILTFVFNANAKDEINNRLQAITVDKSRLLIDSEIGRTFHSFAYHVVVDVCQHTKPIILQGRERTKFIKSIIAAFVDKEEIYRYFRSEALRIDRRQFKDEEQYYNTIRNCRYQTLDGHQVKSEAEKIIADYLFEHDIDYYYENEYVIGDFYPFCKESDRQRLYDLKNKFEEEYIKPDFYLPEYELFWEHWAITGEETNNEINDINSGGYIGDYQFYKDKMNWKKWFYGKSWLNRDVVVKSHKMFTQIFDMRGLIETYRLLAMNREEFENYIEQKLQQVGINKCRLPTKTLIEKVWDKQITTFNKLVEQFIDRTQQSYFRDDKELKQKIEGDFDERTKSFYNIAWRCYEKYQDYFAGKWTDEELELFEEFSTYNVDYNLLMKQAIGFIEDKRSEVIDDLSCKKYILIDEYQDFNKLFYEMLTGIRNIVPDAKLFVVGDNWQAINRFMGADTYYFDSFESVFPDDVARLEISTNYRCATNVIEYAKTFVRKHMGCENNYQASNVECGAAGVVSYDDEQRNKIFEMTQKPEGKLYIDSTIVKAGKNGKSVLNNKFIWYLKKVANLIHQNSNAQKFVILHRNNNTSFYGISQDEFLKRLNMVMVRNRWMSEDEFRQKISIMTIHRAKGLQADVVILLEADAGVIPSFNPNSLLFTVFWENVETVLKDEKNLFYVAITRAKQKLYILHDAKPSGKNGFLEGLHDCVS